MQVFISYSRKDAGFVRGLADDLTARGIDIWLDTEDLATADDDRWRRSIVQGIRESAVLVVVLSPDSVASEQVERELTIAAENKRRIIPIVHRPCELPDGFQFELAGVQRIDFSELPRDVALGHLVRRIGVADEPAAPPPKASPPATAQPPALPAEPAPTPTAHVPITGPGSVLPPPGPAPMAPTVPKPATARPKQLEPAALSTPYSAPSRPRRRLVVGILAAGGAAALAIVLLTTVNRGGDAGNDDLVAGGATETTIGSTDAPLKEFEAPSITAGAAAGPMAAPPTQAATEGTQPAPSAEDVDTQARALVEQLEQAYNTRDWAAVRRLNPNQSDWSDESFEDGYGAADGLPRLEKGHHVVRAVDATGPTTRQLVGTIIAYDLNTQGDENTNVACITWDADVAAGTVAQGGFRGTDGENARRLDGWLPEDQFESTAEQYCGNGPPD